MSVPPHTLADAMVRGEPQRAAAEDPIPRSPRGEPVGDAEIRRAIVAAQDAAIRRAVAKAKQAAQRRLFLALGR